MLIVIVIFVIQCFSALLRAEGIRPSRAPSYVLKPLIGGPSWLPIHIAVVVHYEGSETSYGSFTMDFVPTEPLRASSMLLRGESVPGKFRLISTRKGGVTTEERAFAAPLLDRCTAVDPSFDEGSLHLIRFNCWSFALILTRVLARMSRE